MKPIRLLFALCFISFLTFSARAADKAKDKPADAACDCKKDKDGKECGVDKDCCCTGEKADPSKKKTDDKSAKPVESKPKS